MGETTRGPENDEFTRRNVPEELGDWAGEVLEEDEVLEGDIAQALTKAQTRARNSGNLRLEQKIGRIAAALGITFAAVGAAATYAMNPSFREGVNTVAENVVKGIGDGVNQVNENEKAEKTGRILLQSKILPMNVESASGLSQFYTISGWSGEYGDDHYIDLAIREANKDNTDIDIDNLQPNDKVLVPVRN